MYSKRIGDKWSIPKNIGILPDSLVAAHPSISKDGLTLYFVSDLAGGFGKKDIWKSTRLRPGDTWSKTR
jgi:peptidoglycan-associated lipoprotein